MKRVHNYVATELTKVALIQVYIFGYNPFLCGVMIVNASCRQSTMNGACGVL